MVKLEEPPPPNKHHIWFICDHKDSSYSLWLKVASVIRVEINFRTQKEI